MLTLSGKTQDASTLDEEQQAPKEYWELEK